jgi:hypothetical protein
LILSPGYQDEGEMPSPLLNLAAESGYAEVVKVLLDEASVPVDSLGEFGTSPLFDACYFDNRQDKTQVHPIGRF